MKTLFASLFIAQVIIATTLIMSSCSQNSHEYGSSRIKYNKQIVRINTNKCDNLNR